MRDIIIQLQEEAEDLGFSTIQEAKDAGYEEDINYENGIARLVIDREQEEAHEAWLKEKEEVINSLDHLMLGYVEMGYDEQAGVLQRAIEFIQKGEC